MSKTDSFSIHLGDATLQNPTKTGDAKFFQDGGPLTSEIVDKYRRTSHVFLHNIQQAYDGKRILGNIDLAVKEGELVTVVGSSGCGKSTLLRILLGEELPSAGEFYINNQPAPIVNSDRGIVYQQYSIFPHLTVFKNVCLPLMFANQLDDASISEVWEVLKKVRLDEHATKLPSQLSGGQRQRTAIAQLFISKPKIILMDEPFSALDTGSRSDLQFFLLELQKELNATIFFVTHDLEEAIFLGTRVIGLKQSNGSGARIVYDRALSRIKSNDYRFSSEMSQVLEELYTEIISDKQLDHLTDFALKHEDSFADDENGDLRFNPGYLVDELE